MKHRILMLGAGGIASAIAPQLLSTFANAFPKHKAPDLLWADGDEFEDSNIPRQLLASKHSGKNKVSAMHEEYSSIFPFDVLEDMVHPSTQLPWIPTMILAMVDNNVARQTCRTLSNRYDIPFLWAANEQEEGQALAYFPEHEGTPLDPFERYPNLQSLTTNEGPSCTSDAMLAANPQLPIANHNAGSLLMWMLWAHIGPLRPKNPNWLPAEVTFIRNAIHSSRFADLQTSES